MLTVDYRGNIATIIIGLYPVRLTKNLYSFNLLQNFHNCLSANDKPLGSFFVDFKILVSIQIVTTRVKRSC